MKLSDVITETVHKAPDVQPIKKLNDLSRKYNFANVRTVDWDPYEPASLENTKRMFAPAAFVVYDKKGAELGRFANFDEFLEQGIT